MKFGGYTVFSLSVRPSVCRHYLVSATPPIPLVTFPSNSPHLLPIMRSCAWRQEMLLLSFSDFSWIFQNWTSSFPFFVWRWWVYHRPRGVSSLPLATALVRNRTSPKTLSSLGVKIWNEIPQHVRDAGSLYSFKKGCIAHNFANMEPL